VIQEHRRHTVEEMQRYTRIKADASADDYGLSVVVDAELFRLEGVVRWLDATDARVRSVPSPSIADRIGDLAADSVPVTK
jgi:hypothetical protein